MKRILLFAGTTEGRRIAELCAAHKIPALVCVATGYGETVLPKSETMEIHMGRLDEQEMAEIMERESFAMAVDATHPYAACVTENIKRACRETGLCYVRLLRRESPKQQFDGCRMVHKRDAKEAADYLSGREGNVFLTTGSKELETFASMKGFEERVYARILPLPAMIQKAMDLGLKGNRIIAMQGPFSKEMNEAMFRQTEAAYLVTKESGNAGGFMEKMEAASALGMTAVVIGRPSHETGKSLEEVVDILLNSREICGKAEREENVEGQAERKSAYVEPASSQADLTERRLDLVGIGMGDEGTLTKDAEEAIRLADLVIGAKRMIDRPDCAEKEKICAYLPGDIRDAMEAYPQKRRIVVLLSGDSGFFSGAEAIVRGLALAGQSSYMAAFCQEKAACGLRWRILPGISSLSCLAARAGLPWQDAYAVSAHGRPCAPAGIVSRRKKTYFLLDRTQDIRWLCSRMETYGLSHVRVTAGRDLGSPMETVLSGTPREILGYLEDMGHFADDRDGGVHLECAFVENAEAREGDALHLEDGEFLREEKIPMTKGEIRAISAAKLKLTRDAVVYDIGAGSGGMTVEMAMAAWEGQVYAIEKKEEAVELLKKNCRRFHTDQVTVIWGNAPEAMEALPSPTHALIGGSSGNLEEIVACLLKKNPHVRLVIHAITLETMAEVARVMKTYSFSVEDVVQISAARSHKAGAYHLMKGQNPIFVATLQNPEG